MAILSNEQIRTIKLANTDYHGAAAELVSICRMSFKSGTEIRWRKNNHPQSGIVVFWNGTAAYPTIRVENHRTGKVYEISLHDVDWERMNSLAATYEKEFKAMEEGVK